MSQITGVIHFTFHPGQAERFLELSAQARGLVEANEPGTTRYDVFLSPDRRQATVIEEYVDFDAAMAHQHNMGEELNAAIVETASDVHGEILGDIPVDVAESLVGTSASPFLTVFRSDLAERA